MLDCRANPLPCSSPPCSGALDEERSKRQELQEAMQQVVLNRAAAELEEQAAAAGGAGTGEEGPQQEAGMANVAAEEDGGAVEDLTEAEEEKEAPWVPRVVVLGRLHRGISTAERAGQVVVVRPSHLAAAQQAAAAPIPVVVLPASARKAPTAAASKTPARSAAKPGLTPAPSAAKGRTPAAAGTVGKGATPAGRPTGARSARKTPAAASVLRSPGGVPQLPRSMLKEEPGALVMGGSWLWLSVDSVCSHLRLSVPKQTGISPGASGVTVGPRLQAAILDCPACHP